MTNQHIDRVLELVDQVLDVGKQDDSRNMPQDPSVRPESARWAAEIQSFSADVERIAASNPWFARLIRRRTRVRNQHDD